MKYIRILLFYIMNIGYDVGTYMAFGVCGVSLLFHLIMISIVGWDLNASMSSALSMIEIALSICFAGIVLVLWDKLYKDEEETTNSAFKVGSTLMGVSIVGCIIISGFRLGYTGTIGEGICKECPTIVFREFNTTDSCVFNSFGTSRELWKDSKYPLDWSVKDTYFNKELLYDAFNEGKVQITKEDEIETYGDCWYWGCGENCNPLHSANTVMTWYSCVVTVLLSISTVIMLTNRSPRIKNKTESDLYMPDAVAVPISVPPERVPPERTPTMIINDYEKEQQEIQKELEERRKNEQNKLRKRIDNRQASKGPPDSPDSTQSWNFKLRM